MSNTNALVEVKSSALRWGLIFGLLAGGLIDTSNVLAKLFPVAAASVADLATLYVFSASVIFCGCAGFLAAQKTGYVAHGLQSGLYACVVSGIICIPISWLLSYSINTTDSDIVGRQILAFTLAVGCSFGIYMILAISAGALGGKIAQRIQTRTG